MAQSSNPLTKKALKVIELKKQAEAEQAPELLLKAIKILLKETQIRPLEVDAAPSLGVQEVDVLNVNVLYKQALRMIELQDIKPKIRAKLLRLGTQIAAQQHELKTLALESNGIEGKTFEFQGLKSHKMEVDFDEGNQVEFLLEIGGNFTLDIYRQGQRLEGELQNYGRQNVYIYQIEDTGIHEVIITNKHNQKKSCDFLQSVK